MQAIETKYLSPTNVRGARIKARSDAGSVTIPYPYELSGIDCHAAAALALMRKFCWTGTIYGGALPGGRYAFVCDTDKRACWTFSAAAKADVQQVTP